MAPARQRVLCARRSDDHPGRTEGVSARAAGVLAGGGGLLSPRRHRLSAAPQRRPPARRPGAYIQQCRHPGVSAVGFLAPGAFLVGGALLLAILATYLLRPRRPSRRVSSTFLWLAALNDLQAQRPWRRVPPSVLLLLQIAALAAMIGALARPFLLTAESTGLDTIVLIDASASMQATDVSPSRFAVARARVAQLIDALEPGQTLALGSLDAQPRVVAQPGSDRGQLRRPLDSIQPTTESANLPVALSVAGSLAEGHAGAQVVVVADGAIDRSQVPATFPLPLRYIAVGSAS